tara:strand:- start:23303 stop:24064 length:762 start_codon:yes stop_codon:yes gene_type:complete
MTTPRIIPNLLYFNRGLHKGEKFNNHKYIGDPMNTIKIFSDKYADEIFFLNINETGIPFELLREINLHSLIPFTYGGNISSFNDVEKIISLGVEKISISTNLYDFDLINKISKNFGSQSIIGCIDIKKKDNDYFATTNKGKIIRSKFSWDLIKQLEDVGVGEILFNLIDKEGTLEGYDEVFVNEYIKYSSLPLIYSGGISSQYQIDDLINLHNLSVGVGAFFVLYGRRRSVLIQYLDKDEKNLIKNKYLESNV